MLIEFIATFVLAALLIGILVKTAPRLGLVDVPNHRSSHAKVTPISAGIGIFLAVYLAFALFEPALLLKNLWSFCAVALVFVVGVLDDHRDASPKAKFIVIAFASILLFIGGSYIPSLGTFFGLELVLGLFAFPFTLLAIAGFTNAMNLIDGLDGLAGSISMVIFGIFFFVGYTHDDLFITTTAGFFFAALCAFLLFNWNPAKIFMGDSGSLVLGFVLAMLGIQVIAYIEPVSLLFIMSLPLFDTLIVMTRRIRQGHSPFAPDKTHLHHIFLHFFDGNVKRTVTVLWLMQLAYAFTGLELINKAEQGVGLGLFVVNLTVLYYITGGMLRKQRKEEIRKLRKKRCKLPR